MTTTTLLKYGKGAMQKYGSFVIEDRSLRQKGLP